MPNHRGGPKAGSIATSRFQASLEVLIERVMVSEDWEKVEYRRESIVTERRELVKSSLELIFARIELSKDNQG